MDLMTAPHLSSSDLTSAASTSGDDPTGVALRSFNLACTSGWATTACSSRLSDSTSGAGSFAGPKTPFHV